MIAPRPDVHGKCDRALELSRKGLTNAQIAERLGSNARSVGTMIRNAIAREAKERDQG